MFGDDPQTILVASFSCDYSKVAEFLQLLLYSTLAQSYLFCNLVGRHSRIGIQNQEHAFLVCPELYTELYTELFPELCTELFFNIFFVQRFALMVLQSLQYFAKHEIDKGSAVGPTGTLAYGLIVLLLVGIDDVFHGQMFKQRMQTAQNERLP